MGRRRASPTDADKTLDLDVTRGSLRDVRGRAVAVSNVVAAEGDLRVGDPLRARMADTRAATLRVAAVYDRAAGLGHVVLDPTLARRHAADRRRRGGLRRRRGVGGRSPPTRTPIPACRR